ncbi:hypothetical protein SMG44B_20578 [Stenotrophomonas maltophilia]
MLAVSYLHDSTAKMKDPRPWKKSPE